MTGIVSVSVQSPDLERIAKKLMGDKELNRDMRKALRQQADLLIAAEKAAVMGLSSKGTKGSQGSSPISRIASRPAKFGPSSTPPSPESNPTPSS